MPEQKPWTPPETAHQHALRRLAAAKADAAAAPAEPPKIGDAQQFFEELRQADPSLVGLRFSVAPDGTFNFGDEVTPEQRAAIEAVAEAHDPAKVHLGNRLAALPGAGDIALLRGVEDLAASLIAAGVLKPADLPPALVDKLDARREVRGQPALAEIAPAAAQRKPAAAKDKA